MVSVGAEQSHWLYVLSIWLLVSPTWFTVFTSLGQDTIVPYPHCHCLHSSSPASLFQRKVQPDMDFKNLNGIMSSLWSYPFSDLPAPSETSKVLIWHHLLKHVIIIFFLVSVWLSLNPKERILFCLLFFPQQLEYFLHCLGVMVWLFNNPLTMERLTFLHIQKYNTYSYMC